MQRCWPQSAGEIKDNSLLPSSQTFLAADPQSSIDLKRRLSVLLSQALLIVSTHGNMGAEGKTGTGRMEQSETIVHTWDFSSQTQS